MTCRRALLLRPHANFPRCSAGCQDRNAHEPTTTNIRDAYLQRLARQTSCPEHLGKKGGRTFERSSVCFGDAEVTSMCSDTTTV